MFGRLVITAILAATLASAQRGGGGGGGGRGGRDGGAAAMPMSMGQRQTKFEIFAERLKLSKEQAAEAGNIFTAAMTKAGPLRTQLDQSRTQIAGAMIEGKSQDEINKLLEAHTALEAQVDAVEADAFAKLFATLKPNQQAKAGQAYELMAGIFDRPAGGGGGGGRRGR